jgi:hypothetical protein
LAWQPSCASSLGVTRDCRRAIDRFVETFLCFHQFDQKESERNDGLPVPSLEPIELSPIGQAGEGRTQMLFSITIKGSLARKLDPLAKQSQGNHLALIQRCLWPWTQFLTIQFRLAKIIHHDIEYRKVGIQIHHQLAPFKLHFNKLTVIAGYLFFNPFLIHTKR